MTAPPLESSSATTAVYQGRRLILFAGCNYLALAHHPAVLHAARDALARFGLSASASRETTGNTAPHHELEQRVTRFCGFESGLLVPDGYIANLAAMQGLVAAGCGHAILDERAHASLADAARMAGLHLSRFRHLDAQHAADILAHTPARAVIMTDSVFAADGSVAPCADLASILRPGDRLLLDDCHGFCVLGRSGRGAADAYDLPRHNLVVTTTLAKGLGCAGGMVMADQRLIDTCRRHATAYVCTTPASPILAAAAIAALDLLADDPRLHDSLRDNIARMTEALRAAGITPSSHRTPIFAFTVGTDPQAMRTLHRRAWDSGLWLPLVEYPGGPSETYFRLSVTAAHTAEQIDTLRTTLSSQAVFSSPDGIPR